MTPTDHGLAANMGGEPEYKHTLHNGGKSSGSIGVLAKDFPSVSCLLTWMRLLKIIILENATPYILFILQSVLS